MRRRSIHLFLAAFCILQAAVPDEKAGSAEQGNELFDEQCASCHHAYSPERKAGPSLQSLFARQKLESNGKPVNETNIREMIEKGGRGMPAFKDAFSEDDKADLLAYLKTL